MRLGTYCQQPTWLLPAMSAANVAGTRARGTQQMCFRPPNTPYSPSLCAASLCACAAYPPLYPNFPLSAMDTPLKYHEQELSYAGIDLKKLVDSGKKVRTAHQGSCHQFVTKNTNVGSCRGPVQQ
jgi:hypothetical protein